MPVERIDLEKCDGCAVCVESCSTDVLRMKEQTGKVYAAYPEDCHSCSLCAADCPVGAIQVSFVTHIPKELLPY
ncbi:MAG: ferredoxin family protein [Chloroflexi bacterium]|nr:ferredoxin family protein [Chloroflexota bacterium]